MQTLEIDNDLEARKKLLVSLFWITRKTVKTEGCATLMIKKVVTQNHTYTAEEGGLIKLTDDMCKEIEGDIEAGNPVEFEIHIGEEVISTSLSDKAFSVSTQKSKEIEDDIIQKLTLEMVKQHPAICDSLIPRIT